jgi:hypothetical protein
MLNEWAELASLPRLNQLHVTDAAFTVTPVIPPVTGLRVYGRAPPAGQ